MACVWPDEISRIGERLVGTEFAMQWAVRAGWIGAGRIVERSVGGEDMGWVVG